MLIHKSMKMVLVSSLGVFSLPAFAFAERGVYGPDMMGYGYMNNGWGLGLGILGGIIELAFWIFVVLMVVYVIKYIVSEKRHLAKGGDSALRILRERYARGEINKEEFESRKDDLQGKK